MPSTALLHRLSFGFASIDADGRVASANPELAALFGASAADLVRRRLTDLVPEFSEARPDVPHRTAHSVRPDGSTLAIDLLCAPATEGGERLLFCREVQAGQGKETQKLRQIFDVLSDGLFVTDGTGTTLYVNEAFLQLSGTVRERVVGKTVYTLVEQGLVQNSAAAAVLASGERRSTINVYRNGKTCLVSGAPIIVDGKIDRVVCVIRDLTELNHLRDKLAEASSLSLGYRQQLREIEVQRNHAAIADVRSRAMRDVFEKVTKVASVDVTVLLRGETGVGKDYVVRYIHELSERSKTGTLVKINCGAIPETLLESELFGYERGAFTGADRHGKAGLFEIAKNGTLFLDEIGEMPKQLQVKLLNVVQDKKFYRLGGVREIDFQARIVAATNADLEQMIGEGHFRMDLYHRLNVISVTLPPLRERYDDILPLAMRFLDEINRQYGRRCQFSARTIKLLLAYDWPGNIRELRNVIERLVVMCDDSEGDTADISGLINLSGATPVFSGAIGDQRGAPGTPLKHRVEAFEAECIAEAIEQTETLREAADLLGIDISTLVRKRQRHRQGR